MAEYMDEEARKRQALMQQQGAMPEDEAAEAEYMDSESRREKPKGSQMRKASESEEKQFMLAVKQALGFLGENAQALIDSAQQQDPAQAIAAMAVQVIQGIAQAAGAKGVQLSDEVLLSVGYQFAITAAGLLAAQGVVEQSQEEIQMLAENAVSIGREMVMQSRG